MSNSHPKTIVIKNKKAAYQYFLMDSFTAGIQLTGTEIKSIRTGKASLGEAYCVFELHELYLKNAHIAEYEFGTYANHDPKRDRKLLLTRRELKKLQNKVKEKGFTIIPVQLFTNEKGLAKVEIALARGKHYYDKRETLKKSDAKMDIQRIIKMR
jgi:SsrA-binding protein